MLMTFLLQYHHFPFIYNFYLFIYLFIDDLLVRQSRVTTFRLYKYLLIYIFIIL